MELDDLNLQYGTATTETTPYLVIPKNYGSKTLTINGTWNDWSGNGAWDPALNVTKDLSTDLDISWEPGYIYTYNLTVTPYAIKVNEAKYTEQW